jgi:TonB family protein
MIPSLGNHLWQSTLCVLAAALLARCIGLRYPQVRHGIWLAASLKFLVPFSLFVAAGQQLAFWTPPSLDMPLVPVGLEVIGQPFAGWAIDVSAVGAADGPSGAGRLETVALVALWMMGAATTLGVRLKQRLRIGAIAARSPVLRDGREYEALQRVLARARMRRGVTIRESAATTGPGILGFVRPVLIWPHGLSSRLTDAGIEGIISHEVSHVRRSDNLTGLLHVVVETIFWYHPLVWWLGARLVDDRERACDRAALALGAHPHSYAESMLKVCRFTLRSHAPAMAGVTGSNLNQRMEAIMTYRSGRSLDFGRRTLIAATAALSVVGPLATGVTIASPSQRSQQGRPVELSIPVEVRATTSVAAPVAPGAVPVPVHIDRPVVVPPARQTVSGSLPRPGEITPVSPPPVAPPTIALVEPATYLAAQTPAHDPLLASQAEADEEFRRGALPAIGTPGLTPPVVVRDAKPTYTPEAMRRKLQGAIELEVVIGANGTIERARVLKGLDSASGLDGAALNAIRKWTFVPAAIGGWPVAVWSPIVMNFRLH